MTRWVVGALVGGAIATLAVTLAWRSPANTVQHWFAAGTLAMALTPLFMDVPVAGNRRTGLLVAMLPLAVAILVAVEHRLLTALPLVQASMPPNPAALVTVAVAFVTLMLVQATVSVRPLGRLARTLHPWAFAGFHLDALFTRATFLVWPPRMSQRGAVTPPGPAMTTLGRTR